MKLALASAFFLCASVFVVGCSSEVAEPGADGPPASKLDERGDVTEPGPSVRGERSVGPSFQVGSVAPSEVFVCRKGAFCDDFENTAAPSRWTDKVESRAAIGVGTSSASLGKGSLSLTTKPGDSQAFLVFDGGQVAPKWSGALSFAMRVAEMPARSIGASELIVRTADHGIVSLAFVVTPEGLLLEQRASADCQKACAPKTSLVGTVAAGKWARIELGIEAGGAAPGPYGRVEVRVNGGPLVTTDLSVPLVDGSAFLHAGVTAGDEREAIVDLDDVSLLER